MSTRADQLRDALRTPTDKCIEWEYASKGGDWDYGIVYYQGKDWRCHRLAFYLTHGYLPKVVRHTCDNPKCFNPRHLLGGDFKDNTQDAVKRGRTARSERHGMARLTVEQVKYIRENYRPGKGKHDRGNKRELAEKFGVHPETIWYAARGKSWVYVND